MSKIIAQKIIKNPITQNGSNKMLLRDFISDRLYHQPGGYFCRAEHQVGELKEPINFNKLRGYMDFRDEMEKQYPDNQWLTPSELFKPYYGYTLASWMVNQMANRSSKELKIVEIGPGTGSLADSILDFYKNYSLDLYRNCEYIFVEISPFLAEKCENIMKEKHKRLYDEGRIKIYNCSILDDFLLKKHGPINDHCFVVGMEILDNMPHDRLYQSKDIQDSKYHFQLQSTIEMLQDVNGNEQLKEIMEPIGNDPLILEYLELLKSQQPPDHVSVNKKMKWSGIIKRIKDLYDNIRFSKQIENNVFAPTVALKLFKQVNNLFPNHQMILGDFDCFLTPLRKSSNLIGQNMPIVANKLAAPMDQHEYDHYLIPRGSADICFPTDFHFLQHAYQEITKQPAQIYKHQEFVDIYAQESWTRVQNYHNAMREEYFNTSFMVTEYGPGSSLKKKNISINQKNIKYNKSKKSMQKK